MATLAALFKRMEVEVQPQETAARWLGVQDADPYRLRPLPHEDVYLHSKRIDNSRVVREADPVARRKCWRAIAVSCVAAVYLMAILLPDVLGRVAGYRIYYLQQQHDQLLNEKSVLELEEARLLSPERLEELARTLELVDPVPGQVLVLNPKSDSSLAALVRHK